MIVKQRYNIMLNPNIVRIIDKLAHDSLTSRSYIIGDILSSYIIEHDLVSSFEADFEISGQEVFL